MLDKCPTCMQEVKDEHKHSITSEEDRKLAEIEKEFLLHSNEEDSLRQAVNKINLEIEKIWEEEKKEVMLKARLKELEDSVKQKDAVIERRKKAEDELKNALEKKEQITAGLVFFAEVEKKHIEARKLFDSAALLHRETELKKAQLETRREMSLRALNEISSEIKKKEDAKKILERISLLKQWLEYYFMPMMDDMEKSVMAKAHTDFSSLLSKWFSMLVDNEAISVRLDPEFTPMIEQNGYEIDYGFLSGGEKTAAALAYRLALNQVVNNLMSEIRTKGIIILDEPTDGFSEEQLEKMKFVLDELSIGQIIIVSHEQKIESFVDNVIRFEKAGHVSKVSG
jgi:exonuclease SbcC